MLESELEKSCNALAEKRGLIGLKLAGGGSNGKPDRVFLGRGMTIFFVEFKQAGEKARTLQQWWHKRLARAGFGAYVVDSIEQFHEVLRDEINPF